MNLSTSAGLGFTKASPNYGSVRVAKAIMILAKKPGTLMARWRPQERIRLSRVSLAPQEPCNTRCDHGGPSRYSSYAVDWLMTHGPQPSKRLSRPIRQGSIIGSDYRHAGSSSDSCKRAPRKSGPLSGKHLLAHRSWISIYRYVHISYK